MFSYGASIHNNYVRDVIIMRYKLYTLLCAVTCNYPPTQSLHDHVAVVGGSQDSPPIEGQFITYTCPPGFILTGPNMSTCMGNREWEPDPGEVDCIGNYQLFIVM